jgi:hypothetical protein
MSGNPIREVALIGFGEAGGIFGQDLAVAAVDVAMFDVLLGSEPSRTPMLVKARNAKVAVRHQVERRYWRASQRAGVSGIGHV